MFYQSLGICVFQTVFQDYPLLREKNNRNRSIVYTQLEHWTLYFLIATSCPLHVYDFIHGPKILKIETTMVKWKCIRYFFQYLHSIILLYNGKAYLKLKYYCNKIVIVLYMVFTKCCHNIICCMNMFIYSIKL